VDGLGHGGLPLLSRHSGAMRSIEPGISKSCALIEIPGSSLRDAPE
jgi:hypothetical protein